MPLHTLKRHCCTAHIQGYLQKLEIGSASQALRLHWRLMCLRKPQRLSLAREQHMCRHQLREAFQYMRQLRYTMVAHVVGKAHQFMAQIAFGV